MLPLLALAGIGAATGLINNKFKQDAADRQRKVQAETTRWSPWTGMQAAAPEQPNAFADAFQGGTSGVMMGQGLQNQQFQNKFNSDYLDILRRNGGAVPMNGMGSSGIPMSEMG